MNVDHKKIHDQYKTSTRELPPEYFAAYVPELCDRIDHLESVARETGQLYEPIATEMGGGIHFGYVSDSNVEEQFPRMFRLLLNKVRRDSDRSGFKRAEEYFEKHEIEPLKIKCDGLIETLKKIASGDDMLREHMMNLADNTVRKIEAMAKAGD